MKNHFLFFVVLIGFTTIGLAQEMKDDSALSSLVASERAFAKTSVEKGTRAAFLEFLAEDAIIFRPHPVNGPQWLRERPASPGTLIWRPIFADVSQAGDLGYTTGPWEFRPNAAENQSVRHGQFVSVWAKQPDGTWRVVLDIGIVNPPPVTIPPDWHPLKKSHKLGKQNISKISLEPERNALLGIEQELSKASATKGTANAFLSCISDDARFFRMGRYPVVGKDSIRTVLSALSGTMAWQPMKVDVARSGDLGYSYGSYQVKANAADTTALEKGYYTRIWKKQNPGNWKVVLDIVNPLPN